LKWRVKVIWKYFITLDKDGTIQRQQVNKQQRAWSQSSRQHMVIIVNVARFELRLHEPVKGFPAFILSDLIWKKGVVSLSCFVQIFANILFAWFDMEERGFCLSCYELFSYFYFAFHQSAAGCVQIFISLCYKCISYSWSWNYSRQ